MQSGYEFVFYYSKIDLLVSTNLDTLLQLLNSQIENNFLINKKEKNILEDLIEKVLIKCKKCFEPNLNKYYTKKKERILEKEMRNFKKDSTSSIIN